jgi:hypothetical protein
MESRHLKLFAKKCDNSIRGMFLIKSAIVSILEEPRDCLCKLLFSLHLTDNNLRPDNHDGHMSFKIISSLNTSYSILMETWLQCAVK